VSRRRTHSQFALTQRRTVLSVTAQLNTASTQDISFGISVPQATAQYGFGEMYLQIKGSARYSWIGIGTGFRMAGSQMFIIHTSASGTNLAISQRSSRGNAEPTYNSSSQMHVIEGSGIAGGVMTANIKCEGLRLVASGEIEV
jgi:hypothetical protein